MELNDKAISITNKTAVRLAKERAIREHRSFASAAALSIIECLKKNSKKGSRKQEKKIQI
jgi:hypothetical protein